jgi:hypothetical protein
MTAPVTLFRPGITKVPVGGVAIVSVYGPVQGGFLTNPVSAADQDIPQAEVLYVDVTGADATLGETATTVPIQPGGTFIIPNQTTSVSVNAATSGHSFSGVVFQSPPPFPPTPQVGTFPPAGPVTLTKNIPSYLYQEYNDDEDLQAFVGSYNALAQGYVDWFVQTPLAVYTDPSITGSLLDWVAAGLYGMRRPALSSGRGRFEGPYNTIPYNFFLPLNGLKKIGPSDVTVTSDDIFKRILTWNLYRGDGNVFSIRWLKRRVMRFLTGPNGTAPNVPDTSPISITVGAGIIVIRITVGTRAIVNGPYNKGIAWNRLAYNQMTTLFTPKGTPLPFESVLKEAVESGVLQLPFQYLFLVSV